MVKTLSIVDLGHRVCWRGFGQDAAEDECFGQNDSEDVALSDGAIGEARVDGGHAAEFLASRPHEGFLAVEVFDQDARLVIRPACHHATLQNLINLCHSPFKATDRIVVVAFQPDGHEGGDREYTGLGVDPGALRMERHSDTALQVAEWLLAQSGVAEVRYPGCDQFGPARAA